VIGHASAEFCAPRGGAASIPGRLRARCLEVWGGILAGPRCRIARSGPISQTTAEAGLAEGPAQGHGDAANIV